MKVTSKDNLTYCEKCGQLIIPFGYLVPDYNEFPCVCDKTDKYKLKEELNGDGEE